MYTYVLCINQEFPGLVHEHHHQSVIFVYMYVHVTVCTSTLTFHGEPILSP